MSEAGNVTLIFYRVGKQWWREPALNLIAAAAQRSSYTHVELAIGSDSLDNGEMTNVVRIFNDPVGAEVTHRTGKNPLYSHLAMQAWQDLLFGHDKLMKHHGFAQHSRGLCTELVAAVLKVGGLMSFDSNPGAATPYSLYKMYSKQGAATANPYVLTSLKRINERESLLPISMPRSVSETPHTSTLSISSSRRASPPRAPFRILNTRSQNTQPGSVQLTLNSLR